ncbi:hypothetical protein RRL34_004251 [Vibrio parahaemolyticus]|nr:hypothetical protein [Vibrio parahaemolyticus]
MNKLENPVQISLNKNNQYRIEIDGKAQQCETLHSRKVFRKFLENNFKQSFTLVRDTKTAKMYPDEFHTYIVITEGDFKGSFACINDLGALMSLFDKDGKKGEKWIITTGNPCNDVADFSEYDAKRWIVNKPYEKFQAKVAQGKQNHFFSALKLYKRDCKDRGVVLSAIASLLAMLSEEERELVNLNADMIIERNANEPVKTKKAKKSNAKSKKTVELDQSEQLDDDAISMLLESLNAPNEVEEQNTVEEPKEANQASEELQTEALESPIVDNYDKLVIDTKNDKNDFVSSNRADLDWGRIVEANRANGHSFDWDAYNKEQDAKLENEYYY